MQPPPARQLGAAEAARHVVSLHHAPQLHCSGIARLLLFYKIKPNLTSIIACFPGEFGRHVLRIHKTYMHIR